jgi:hypothetical protein
VWGWDEGSIESVQDARNRTRGQAIERYCRDIGERFIEIRAWKRYARGLTIVDNWIWWVESCTDEGWDGGYRDLPPDGWEAPDDEDMPAWEMCLPTDEGAIPIWILGQKGFDMPPRRKAVNA